MRKQLTMIIMIVIMSYNVLLIMMSFYFVKKHWFYINICQAIVISILEDTGVYNNDVDMSYGVDTDILVA